MTGNRFNRGFIARRRRSLARVLAGWMTLSLVFAFWPCCQTLAQDQLPFAHAEAGDHGNPPYDTDGPCRTWLDNADATLNHSLDVLIAGFDLKLGHAVYAHSRDFPAVSPPARARLAYHPPPPNSLPLYLRVRHLLI